ncbi:MAG: nucleoside-diphosphate kinase [Candidatus Cloacimonetes bacterium]|nr:nucleoside-diphosphate kinase [Candidatus Cloacimonadota bacterium]
MEKTLVLIKPDAVRAGKIGEIISMFEAKKFKIDAMLMFRFTNEIVERFYAVHREKDFFPDLLKFMTSGNTIAMIVSGQNTVSRVRNLIGPTDPAECEPDTVRGRFATSVRRNAVHASDSHEHYLIEKEVIFG